MSDQELKPCPFCGGQAAIRRTPHKKEYGPVVYYARCTECDSRGSLVRIEIDMPLERRLLEMAHAKGLAAEAWNRRAP